MNQVLTFRYNKRRTGRPSNNERVERGERKRGREGEREGDIDETDAGVTGLVLTLSTVLRWQTDRETDRQTDGDTQSPFPPRVVAEWCDPRLLHRGQILLLGLNFDSNEWPSAALWGSTAERPEPQATLQEHSERTTSRSNTAHRPGVCACVCVCFKCAARVYVCVCVCVLEKAGKRT